jgi:hypothetical protein
MKYVFRCLLYVDVMYHSAHDYIPPTAMHQFGGSCSGGAGREAFGVRCVDIL